jgi:hypothetical protein
LFKAHNHPSQQTAGQLHVEIKLKGFSADSDGPTHP